MPLQTYKDYTVDYRLRQFRDRLDEDGLRQTWALDGKRQARLLGRRPKDARQVCGVNAKIGGLINGPDATALDACEVEQRVDEFQKP